MCDCIQALAGNSYLLYFPKAICCMCEHVQLIHSETISLDVVTVLLRSRRYNALRDIIYHTLLVHDAGSRFEGRCIIASVNRLGCRSFEFRKRQAYIF